MIYGDALVGDPFKKGDYFKVIIKGTTKAKTTSTVEYYLADYRSENEAEHYMLTDWKWFDLSVLGPVTEVTLSVTASRSDNNGLTTPAYLCMDNLGAQSPMPVGIDEGKSESFSIYPIPTSDILNISTSEMDYTVKIYSIQGKLVLSETNLSENNQIDVTSLSAGSYIFELNSQNGRQVKNFIKK